MPKKPDEYGLLLNRAGPLCEALAAKGYAAVMGQAVHVFTPAPPGTDTDGPAFARLGVPITFFGPGVPQTTIYLTADTLDSVREQVERVPGVARSRLVLPDGPLQA
jgi:hypothetical protein